MPGREQDLGPLNERNDALTSKFRFGYWMAACALYELEQVSHR